MHKRCIETRLVHQNCIFYVSYFRNLIMLKLHQIQSNKKVIGVIHKRRRNILEGRGVANTDVARY